MKRITILIAAMTFAAAALAAPRNYELKSPDGKLVVTVEAGEELNYSLSHESDKLLDKSPLGMYLEDGTVFGGSQSVKKVSRRSVNETISAVVYKKAEVQDVFNEMTLKFQKFSVIFRAYDDGMAYRFVSHIKTPYNVENETVRFNFAQDWNMWAAYVVHNTWSLEGQYFTSNEAQYTYTPLSEWNKDRIAMLPLMVDGPSGKKIVVTEADNRDYPCFYLYNYEGGKELTARIPAFPKDLKQGGHNNLQMIVESRENHIAKCK